GGWPWRRGECCSLGLALRTPALPGLDPNALAPVRGFVRKRHHGPAHRTGISLELDRREDMGAERPFGIADRHRGLEQRRVALADEQFFLFAADEDRDRLDLGRRRLRLDVRPALGAGR